MLVRKQWKSHCEHGFHLHRNFTDCMPHYWWCQICQLSSAIDTGKESSAVLLWKTWNWINQDLLEDASAYCYGKHSLQTNDLQASPLKLDI